MRWIVLSLIRLYQLVLSPFLGHSCRFTPSCSEYTDTCIRRFGLIRGSWLGLRRLSSCHPWGRWGYDPPPLERETSPIPK